MEIIGDVAEHLTLSGEFLRSEAACTDGVDFFLVTSDRYEIEITPDNVNDLPRVLIPSDHFQPPFDAEKHSLVPKGTPENCYVKIPALIRYNPKDEGKLLGFVLHEAEVCEVLKKNPHPNIAKYYGCKVKGNRIVGLCFEKYSETLFDWAEHERTEEAKQKCLNEILSGIRHLHGLGFCHNDLNPSNIMFDEDGAAFIIDFDSCQRTGHKLGMKKGTQRFCDLQATTSEEKNDFYSLDKIRLFVETGEGGWRG